MTAPTLGRSIKVSMAFSNSALPVFLSTQVHEQRGVAVPFYGFICGSLFGGKRTILWLLFGSLFGAFLGPFLKLLLVPF